MGLSKQVGQIIETSRICYFILMIAISALAIVSSIVNFWGWLTYHCSSLVNAQQVVVFE